jgi:hypothetical protein
MSFRISILLFLILCSGCFSSRKYYFEYNQKNKDAIRNIFTNGRTSCDNGYCISIKKEDSTKNSYYFDGEKSLFVSAKLKSKSKDNEASFLVKLRIKNIGIVRLKKMEALMLDEIGYRLSQVNSIKIQEYLRTIKPKE